MLRFYSHGKLLLTAEYVVLDGAKALALPTKYGQSLTVKTIEPLKLIWKSIDYKGVVWFEDIFDISNTKISQFVRNNNPVSKRLIEILNAAKILNPEFLDANNGYEVVSTLEFPNNWGLGSSSTLLNNIAQWAKIDAFILSNITFGGSGYDIACANNNTAILYYLNHEKPKVESVLFNKNYLDELFFVHLNRKQNSRDSIKTYRKNKSNTETIIDKINTITSNFLKTETLNEFNSLINEHETLIGAITNQTPIKQRLFKDFKNEIKSLGGWNGDFILATGKRDYVHSYFKERNYNTIIDYKDMIL